MECLTDRFTKEAEAAGLTTQSTNRPVTPLPLEGAARAGIRPEEVEDRDRSSVILFGSHGGCGRRSGAPASLPARTIGGVANSVLVT